MKIRDVMTSNPNRCIPEASATQAARIMDQMHVGIVPVVVSDTNPKLVGVVTDRDLCLSVVAADKHPSSVQVSNCMTSEIVACRPEDDIQKALDLMSKHQVRRVPVINEQGLLQGMVSTADIWQRSNLSSDFVQRALKDVTSPTREASKPRAKMAQQGSR